MVLPGDRWCGADAQETRTERHDPTKSVGAGVSICFLCSDALSIYHQARTAGPEPDEPFVGNALWVTGLRDPDGFRIDFESPTDVPEGTRLSQL
jgi:hypothetical protein